MPGRQAATSVSCLVSLPDLPRRAKGFVVGASGSPQQCLSPSVGCRWVFWVAGLVIEWTSVPGEEGSYLCRSSSVCRSYSHSTLRHPARSEGQPLGAAGPGRPVELREAKRTVRLSCLSFRLLLCKAAGSWPPPWAEGDRRCQSPPHVALGSGNNLALLFTAPVVRSL